MVVNVRTHDDLRDLLRNRASGNWIVGIGTEPRIKKFVYLIGKPVKCLKEIMNLRAPQGMQTMI